MLSRSGSLLAVPVVLALAVGCNADGQADTSMATLGGDTGEGEGEGDGDGDGSSEGAFTQPRLRILLGRQYVNAIAELLGPAAAMAASSRADVTLNGFDAIGAAQLSLSDADVDIYESSAGAVAAVALADPATLASYFAPDLTCTATQPGDLECMRSFVAKFGLMAWRRPLEQDEVMRWVDVGLSAALDFDSFAKGLEFVVAGMLQSPNFLYQVEIGAATQDGSGQRKLSSYELATRLSFFLLDTTPSRALLDAAEAGELDSEAGVRAWAEQMLLDPRSRASFNNYFEEVLHLRKLDELAKDPGTFPSWTPYLAQSMKAETLAVIDEVVWIEDGDFRNVLDADFTFVDQTLADHYGVAYPGPAGFQKVPVPAGEKRGGIFGHAGLLSVLAHVSSTSPTVRGKFIQERVLCTSIPPPPPGVVTDLPSTEEAQTMRERLALHQADPTCAGCHVVMDPPGLGLENYDGIGNFRTLDNGVVIDSKSDISGIEFDGALELGQVVREFPKFSRCTIMNLYRHGTGHVEAPGELVRLADVDAEFIASDYRFKAAIVEIVASRAFRYVGEQD